MNSEVKISKLNAEALSNEGVMDGLAHAVIFDELAAMSVELIDHLCAISDEEYEPTGYYTPARIKELVENGYTIIMAHDATGMVGMAWLVGYNSPEYLHAFLHMLYVRSAYRKQGIGKALMDAAEAHTLEQGLTHLDLEVGVANTGVIAMYQNRGYFSDRMTFVKEL